MNKIGNILGSISIVLKLGCLSIIPAFCMALPPAVVLLLTRDHLIVECTKTARAIVAAAWHMADGFQLAA